VGDVQILQDAARQAVQQHLAAGRPSRTRRAPVLL
jgi:hypothetical protein